MLSNHNGVESGIEVGGVAEELAEVLSDSIGEVLYLAVGVTLGGDTFHEHLGDIIGNCGNLEDLLEEGLEHVGDLALIGVVAESEVTVEGLVILTPV